MTGPSRNFDPEHSLDELAGLATAAGADVRLRVLQERAKPDPATFLGSGKVETLAAAKQCGRTTTPDILEPVPLAARIAESGSGLRLIAWEDATERGWNGLPDAVAAVTVLLGPEGGFAADEAARAQAAGFHPVSLGGRVLRADTAAVVVVALCQHRWGDG